MTDHDDDQLPDEPLPEELGIDIDEFADELPDDDEDDAAPALAALDVFDAGPDLHALDDVTFVGRIGVLERLGPAHFRSKGFSFMGFLQTVYEHVATEITPPKMPEPREPQPESSPASEVVEPQASPETEAVPQNASSI